METRYPISKLTVLTLLLFFKIGIVNAQLKINDGHYQVDKQLQLIVCNAMPDNITASTTSIDLGKKYVFSTPINAIKLGVAYDVTRNDTTYKLYFTRLPLINLSVKEAITSNETGGLIDITDTLGTSYKSDIGIKIRGAYSSTLPKKPYRVQLWTDSTGKTTKDESIFGLRSDKRWLLLAMYNEKLRLNNKVSHDLWRRLHKLYYADKEPDAQASIRTRYVDVFLNNTYQGVYLFAEDMDRKELKLKKQTTAGTGGELYKGDSWGDANMFTGVPALPIEETELWGGWELTYPDADQTDWQHIYNFTNFAVNASDSSFSQQISTKIREDNFVDYFIFLNLLRAEDNQGKNLFLARYNETDPYFITPWDLDGTWGYYWTGDRRDITNDVLSNNLFNRLINSTSTFKKQLAARWFSLRANLLSTDSLCAQMTANYSFLSGNGVYERENRVWSGDYLSYGQDELDYAKNWIQARATWLDSYFRNFAGDQPIIYSFGASVPDSGVVLTWSANCSAIHSFDVEVSTDQVAWRKITPNSLLASDSATCNYSFTDTEIAASGLYYRLKVMAKSDSILYSSVLSINPERSFANSVLSLYPNPVSTTLMVRGDVDRINVYSLPGIPVYESDSSTGNVIDMARFPVGIYLVRITHKNGLVSSHRVIVNR
ncbi:hypothetical protein GCM10028819_25230 [Spirosoma humi]